MPCSSVVVFSTIKDVSETYRHAAKHMTTDNNNSSKQQHMEPSISLCWLAASPIFAQPGQSANKGPDTHHGYTQHCLIE